MKRIKRLVSKQEKEGGKVLYTYLIDDDSSEPYKVSTIDRTFEIGEKVAVIWTDQSTKYNTGYLKRICKRCDKQYKEIDAVKHEFCHVSHTSDY